MATTIKTKPPKAHRDGSSPGILGRKHLAWLEESQMFDDSNGNVPLGHASEGMSCEASEKLLQQVTNVNTNQERVLKKVSATQKVRDGPKDSPSRAVFMFWANKVNSSSKMSTFQKLQQKPPVTVGCCSPDVLPEEGFNSLEEKEAKNPQRKPRRDLFSDSKVFSHVESHVLHVSQQVAFKESSRLEKTFYIIKSKH